MSLYNTRTVGDVKVVMLKGQDGKGSIPSGGTAGQVLTKSGDADYEVIWSTLKNSRAVELSETNIQTKVGTAKTVTVKYRVAGISDTATYTSSDTGVATVAVTGHSSTGTSATDVITITPVANGDCTIKIAFANEVEYDAEYDYINVTVGAASGSSSKKTHYTITASSWSASANSDGYYTYTQTLDPAVKSSPDVYVAGSTNSTQPTDAERVQFGYVERCKVNGSTLTLYAGIKPIMTFYIWVEGEEGETSSDVVGNIISPNFVGSNVYSQYEKAIGLWMGRTLYRRCYRVPSFPNAGSVNIPTGLSNIKPLFVYGFMSEKNGLLTMTVPATREDSLTQYQVSAKYYTDNSQYIELACESDRSNFEGFMVVEYYKL